MEGIWTGLRFSVLPIFIFFINAEIRAGQARIHGKSICEMSPLSYG